jgi:hypothetical protein
MYQQMKFLDKYHAADERGSPEDTEQTILKVILELSQAGNVRSSMQTETYSKFWEKPGIQSTPSARAAREKLQPVFNTIGMKVDLPWGVAYEFKHGKRLRDDWSNVDQTTRSEISQSRISRLWNFICTQVNHSILGG